MALISDPLTRREIENRGNLQIPAELTLRESEDELQDAQVTHLYLTQEADRLSAKDKALDVMSNNLINWLKEASEHENYTRTAKAASNVSLLFKTLAQFIKADNNNKHKTISSDDIDGLIEALGVKT
jgi:hypothetical protein